ncbi:MAG: hypothetical protein HKN09_02550 [Saprospiraceae bacterium]|nr:hypothetical protein [Saprospiraceae bacterium]
MNQLCKSLDNVIRKVHKVERKYELMQKNIEHPSLKRKLTQMMKDRKRFKRGLRYCINSLSDAKQKINPLQKSSEMKLGIVDDNTHLHPSVVIKDAINESRKVEQAYKKALKNNYFPPRISQLLLNQKNKIKNQQRMLMGFRNELGYVQS